MRRVPTPAALALLGFAAWSGCTSTTEASTATRDSEAATSTELGGTTAMLDVPFPSSDGAVPDPRPDAGSAGPAWPQGHALENFAGADGEPWPSPWIALGGVNDHEIVDGRGRLRGVPRTVARMAVAGIDGLDFDAEFTVEFDDWTRQGVGLYVRQNGGWLRHTDPPGQGYGVYLEGGFQQQLGVWRERAGVEELVGGSPLTAIEPLVPYRVRLQCIQMENATLLRTKIWAARSAEPAAWAVELIDVTPELQDIAGDIAIDMYNYQGSGSVYVDDLVVRPPS